MKANKNSKRGVYRRNTMANITHSIRSQQDRDKDVGHHMEVEVDKEAVDVNLGTTAGIHPCLRLRLTPSTRATWT